MKKIIPLIFVASLSSLSFAEFNIRLQIEKNSINFIDIPSDSWVEQLPIVSDWSTDSISGCNYFPTSDIIISGHTFSQKSEDCIKNQSRLVQRIEKNLTDNSTITIGEPFTENQVLTSISDTKNDVGSKTFAGSCSYRDSNYNSMSAWGTSSSFNFIHVTLSTSSGIVRIHANVIDSSDTVTGSVVPNLTRINDSYMTYKIGNELWHILKGTHYNGSMYQACIDKSTF